MADTYTDYTPNNTGVTAGSTIDPNNEIANRGAIQTSVNALNASGRDTSSFKESIETTSYVRFFDDNKIVPGVNTISINADAVKFYDASTDTEQTAWPSLVALSVGSITNGVMWAIYPGKTYTATDNNPASKPANAYRVFNFVNNAGTITTSSKTFQDAIDSNRHTFESTIEFRGAVTNNYPRLSASVAANALTITLSGGSFSFRSSSLTSGLLITLAVSSAVTLTIPSGTTIGTTNNDSSRIHVYAINNAGTIELALSGNPGIDTSLVFNTTAISGGTSRDLLYSTTARTSVPVVYLGFITAPQATAGTWASAPTQITVAPQYASSTAQLRLSTGNGHGSTNTTIRRFATIVEDRSAGYFTYADSATAGASFTINLGGLYSISYSDGASAASSRVGISRNSTQLTTSIESITNADRLQAILVASGLIGNVGVTVNLLPGDVIRPHTSGAPNFNTAGNTAFVMTYAGG